jgi:squalene synthase HpnC
MTSAGSLRSGKSHRDENFPVASWLIHPRHRGLILAFYQFVRTADDIADHATLAADEKLAMLDQLEADLDGRTHRNPEGVALRTALATRGMSARHAKDLLTAFRLDVTKLRYRDWDDLINYCSYSAMPVGRFVCDVHGESQAVWPASDALCAALQIINHLQDCKADYRNLDRVYVPLDALAAVGLGVEALGQECASPALLSCLHKLADRTELLLRESDDFAGLVQDQRLGLEIAVIVRLAHRLTHVLMRRDALSERVHLGKLAVAGTAAAAVVKHGARSFGRRTFARAPVVRDL